MSRYVSLDWAAIREEWETTRIGLNELARKHGISSSTTIRRRRTVENWTKNEAVVASEAILDSFAIDEPPATASADPELPLDAPPPGKMVALNWKPPGDRPQEHLPQPPERLGSTENLTGMSATERLLRTVTEAEDALAIKSRRELIVARTMQLSGVLVHESIQALLTSGTNPNPALEEARMVRYLQRLIRLNPDRDSLAGLLTAASKCMDMGVAMERQALAEAAAAKAAQPKSNEDSYSLIREFISKLDVETAMKMRQFVLEVQAKRREAEIAGLKK
jgi:hypothetical protein